MIDQEQIRKSISSLPVPFYEIASQERKDLLTRKHIGTQQNPLASGFFKREKEKEGKKITPLKRTYSRSTMAEKKGISPAEEASSTSQGSSTQSLVGASSSSASAVSYYSSAPNASSSHAPHQSAPSEAQRSTRKRRQTSKRNHEDEDEEEKIEQEDDDIEALLQEAENTPSITAEENAYCKKVLRMLMKHDYGWPFNQPVDPRALNIPDYFDVIKRPMDFSTIMTQLQRNQYQSIKDFVDDVELVFSNARTYNSPGSDVYIMADTLANYFHINFKPKKKKS